MFIFEIAKSYSKSFYMLGDLKHFYSQQRGLRLEQAVNSLV
jgi:hypothetical protein